MNLFKEATNDWYLMVINLSRGGLARVRFDAEEKVSYTRKINGEKEIRNQANRRQV